MTESVGNVCFATISRKHEALMSNDPARYLVPVLPDAIAWPLRLKVCKHCGSVYAEIIQPKENPQ